MNDALKEYSKLYKEYNDLKDQLMDISDTGYSKQERALALKIREKYNRLINLKRSIVQDRHLNALFKSKN
jgi:cell fate (sporulation/competence/biofilm development) regulator YlbF (YheA/YmcA/DUF963 family)